MECEMKKFVAVLFLLLCSTSLIHSQKTRLGQTPDKPNPADFTIKVHISASHFETECVSGICRDLLHADTILNGKKIMLQGVAVIYKGSIMLLAPGDYPAKLTKNSQNPNSAWFSQAYDILLPDGTAWHCAISGISE
jgi:hypothetical protein